MFVYNVGITAVYSGQLLIITYLTYEVLLTFKNTQLHTDRVTVSSTNIRSMHSAGETCQSLTSVEVDNTRKGVHNSSSQPRNLMHTVIFHANACSVRSWLPTMNCSSLETKCWNNQSLAGRSTDADSLRADLGADLCFILYVQLHLQLGGTPSMLQVHTNLNIVPDLDSNEVLQLVCHQKVLCHHPISSNLY